MRPEKVMRISIIVPTLNEERALAATLEHLLEISPEVVVSDGSSQDATRSIANKYPVTWVEGEAGRGVQLNRGARAASGDVLLFVHADTTLPEDTVRRIEEALEDGAVGGGFEVRFSSDRAVMRLGSRLASLRTRLSRIPLGDQAQFVRAEVFRQMGGFQEWPILEDLDFARRLKAEGRVRIPRASVSTSDRRFARSGILRTLGTNYLIWTLFLFGMHPKRLARLYRQVR